MDRRNSKKLNLQQIVSIIKTRKHRFVKIGQVFMVLLIILTVLGLCIYLQGPKEVVVGEHKVESINITLSSNENDTYLISLPYKLLEYQALNLTSFLINRTISINISTVGGTINFYLMNFQQLESWQKNGSLGWEVSKVGLKSFSLEILPRTPW